MEHNAVDPIM